MPQKNNPKNCKQWKTKISCCALSPLCVVRLVRLATWPLRFWSRSTTATLWTGGRWDAAFMRWWPPACLSETSGRRCRTMRWLAAPWRTSASLNTNPSMLPPKILSAASSRRGWRVALGASKKNTESLNGLDVMERNRPAAEKVSLPFFYLWKHVVALGVIFTRNGTRKSLINRKKQINISEFSSSATQNSFFLPFFFLWNSSKIHSPVCNTQSWGDTAQCRFSAHVNLKRLKRRKLDCFLLFALSPLIKQASSVLKTVPHI